MLITAAEVSGRYLQQGAISGPSNRAVNDQPIIDTASNE